MQAHNTIVFLFCIHPNKYPNLGYSKQESTSSPFTVLLTLLPTRLKPGMASLHWLPFGFSVQVHATLTGCSCELPHDLARCPMPPRRERSISRLIVLYSSRNTVPLANKTLPSKVYNIRPALVRPFEQVSHLFYNSTIFHSSQPQHHGSTTHSWYKCACLQYYILPALIRDRRVALTLRIGSQVVGIALFVQEQKTPVCKRSYGGERVR